MGSIEENIWVEKYRPKKLSDMVLDENEMKTFQSWINKKEIPHTLFVGKPGSGKTTLARVLIDEVITNKDTDVLEFNGSIDRGINTVREMIEEFLRTIIMGDSKTKIVFVDEFDGMTPAAQNALRNMIEKYSKTGRFLLTANYESKIDEAIHSRMQTFKFKEFPKSSVFKHIIKILKSEGIEHDEEQDVLIKRLINNFHPDVRRILNTIQKNCANETLLMSQKDTESIEKICRSYITDLIDATKNGNSELQFKTLKNIDAVLKEAGDIDYRSVYEQICDDNNLPAWAQIVVEKFCSNHLDALIPRFHFKAMMFSIIEIGKKYREI